MVACFRAGLGVFAAFFCVAAIPCAAQGNLDPAVVSSHADAWLKPYQEVGDFSGVVLLAQGDKILFQKAYGLSDPQVGLANRLDTRFRIASVSKTFTAAAIEKLVADGKVRYSDSLSHYVEGIPNGDSITIEQLLAHESGAGVFDSEDVYRDCLSRQDLLRRLSAAKPRFAPGKKSEYSNEGYFLLASVIERVTGLCLRGYTTNQRATTPTEALPPRPRRACMLFRSTKRHLKALDPFSPARWIFIAGYGPSIRTRYLKSASLNIPMAGANANTHRVS